MDPAAHLPAFLLAVVIVTATPGPAMALILRRAAVRGTLAAVPTVLGLELGLFLWALAAGVGLAAVVAASQAAYTVLRVVGAVVLLVLGIRAWRSAWRDRDAPPPQPGRRRAHSAFLEGLVVQLANPKAAIFLFSFYPQFVPDEGRVLAWSAGLGLLQVAVETVLYLVLALAVGRASSWFGRPRIRRRFEALSGTVLVALGARVAVAGR